MSERSLLDELPGELMMWVLIVSELLVFGAGLAAFMAVMPISALVLSYVLLGDPFQWIQLAGMAIVLAGLAFSMMDLFNEMVNSAIFHLTDRAPLWTVTGDTSYLIFIGLTIEILLLFAVSGVAFVKTLPPDRKAKILGIPNRIVFVTVFSLFCVAVEIFLHSTGYFHW